MINFVQYLTKFFNFFKYLFGVNLFQNFLIDTYEAITVIFSF